MFSSMLHNHFPEKTPISAFGILSINISTCIPFLPYSSWSIILNVCRGVWYAEATSSNTSVDTRVMF